jgi:hypothetical protein
MLILVSVLQLDKTYTDICISTSFISKMTLIFTINDVIKFIRDSPDQWQVVEEMYNENKYLDWKALANQMYSDDVIINRDRAANMEHVRRMLTDAAKSKHYFEKAVIATSVMKYVAENNMCSMSDKFRNIILNKIRELYSSKEHVELLDRLGLRDYALSMFDICLFNW